MDDLEIIKLSEASQTKKCKYVLSYVESKKMIQVDLFTKWK